MRVVGLDLAGNPKNDSGYCLLEVAEKKVVKCRILHSDEEIMTELRSAQPELVAVDGPLTFDGRARNCDELLREYGTLPVTFRGMETLARRSSSLGGQIGSAGLKTVEVYAKATANILGVYSKDDFTMQKSMMGLDIEGDVNVRLLTRDELDAVLAALTGYLHALGQTELVGDESGSIAIPKV